MITETRLTRVFNIPQDSIEKAKVSGVCCNCGGSTEPILAYGDDVVVDDVLMPSVEHVGNEPLCLVCEDMLESDDSVA